MARASVSRVVLLVTVGEREGEVGAEETGGELEVEGGEGEGGGGSLRPSSALAARVWLYEGWGMTMLRLSLTSDMARLSNAQAGRPVCIIHPFTVCYKVIKYIFDVY